MINKEAMALIKSHGYEMVRQKKHFVFKHTTTGQLFVCSKSSSDYRSLRNIERDLKKLADYGEKKMS